MTGHLSEPWTQYCIAVGSPVELRDVTKIALAEWRQEQWDHPLSESTTWVLGDIQPEDRLASLTNMLRDASSSGPSGPLVRRVFGLVIIGSPEDRGASISAATEAPWAGRLPLTVSEAESGDGGVTTGAIVVALQTLMEALTSNAGGPHEFTVSAEDVDEILPLPNPSREPVDEHIARTQDRTEESSSWWDRQISWPQDINASSRWDRSQSDQLILGLFSGAPPAQSAREAIPSISYPSNQLSPEPDGINAVSNEPSSTVQADHNHEELGVRSVPPVARIPLRQRINDAWSQLAPGIARRGRAAEVPRDNGLLLFVHALDSRTLLWGERAQKITAGLLQELRSSAIDWQAGIIQVDDAVSVISYPLQADKTRPWRPTDPSLGFLLTDAARDIGELTRRYKEAWGRRGVDFARVIVVIFSGEYPLVDSSAEDSYDNLRATSTDIVWVIFGNQDTSAPELLHDPPATILLVDHEDIVSEITHTVLNR